MSKGVSRHRKEHPHEYNSWAQMRSRCSNPNVPEYQHYGAKGIKVCQRWDSFANFLADMGERPDGCSIDRIVVGGDYEPGNCRWATRAQQARNTTKTRYVTIGEETKPLCDWIAERGLNGSTVRVRLLRGWPVERALS